MIIYDLSMKFKLSIYISERQIQLVTTMKNRVLALILILSILLSFLCVTVQAQDNTEAVISDSIYHIGDIADEPKLTFEYNSKEQAKPADYPEIGCEAAYVADPVSGKVFFEKNAHKKMYPASTTKILTALVVLENCDPDDKAVVSQNAVSSVPAGYVTGNLKAGEKLSIFNLLQALLIPSANEAAVALAEHVSGSVSAFAELCNKRAKELGCENLHFVNPNGIHDDNHYCTAYDLYLIARECRKFDIFNNIVKTRSFTLPATDVYPLNNRTFENTNKLLDPNSAGYFYSNCTGIKTGYTDKAGQCLVGKSMMNGLELISVVLGGKIKANGDNERFSDTKKLFEWVYNHYSYNLIADKSKPLAQVSIKNATKDTALLDIVIQTDIKSVAPVSINSENVVFETDLPEEIKAPLAVNQVIGTVTYSVDGLVYTTNLVAKTEVIKKPYWLYNLIVVLIIVILVIIIISIRNKKRKELENERRRAYQNRVSGRQYNGRRP